MNGTSDMLILLIVIALRLLVPLAIPRYPIPAGIAALVIDGVDQTIFQRFTTLSPGGLPGLRQGARYLLPVDRVPLDLRNWTNLDAVLMSRFLLLPAGSSPL